MTSQVLDYVDRRSFIIARCSGKRVLHLGCVGATGGSIEQRVWAMENNYTLHAYLREAAAEIVGVDHARAAVDALRERGYTEIICGDVQQLDKLAIDGAAFDVIVCGDLIEHLDSPGALLQGVRRFCAAGTELLISTPNAFSLPNFMRYMLGTFRESSDHVTAFSLLTLTNLLQRHGFRVKERYTGHLAQPANMERRLRYRLGKRVLRKIPKVGGTLIVVAVRDDAA